MRYIILQCYRFITSKIVSTLLLPSVLGLRERNQLLLLEILVTYFNTVPAHAGVIARYLTEVLYSDSHQVVCDRDTPVGTVGRPGSPWVLGCMGECQSRKVSLGCLHGF